MWVHIIEFAFGLDGSIFILWIIHGSPVEGRLNWDVVLLSRVLGGSRALGRKFFVVPNIGAGTREMRAMMVWGLSLCLATAWVQGISLFWRVGLGSCRPLPASRAEAWNVHGVAHVVTGPCPGGAAALPWVTCCVYCYLPGFGLWGIVDAQYVLNTSSTSLIISHACLRWTWLFGACWTALYVVGVSLFCEAGSAVSGLVTRQLWWPWFACLAVLMFTYGNLMHVGHRSAVLCLLLTLLGFVLTLHRTGNDFINLTGNSDFVLVNMSEELSRSRAACRGWVTRECKNLATTLEDPELNVVKLSAAMDEFDKRLTNLDDVQSRYELSLENEDAILNDITTAADFRDSARKVRILASEKLKELSGDSGNKSAAHVSSFSMTDVKLPKLNLPVFNGDVLQWQSFWDQFVAAVDSTDLPDVSKFSYLRASLEGEPKAAIQGLSLTSAHYASACKILKDRFGRKETIIFSHIQELLNLSVPSKCSVSALWKLNDDLQAHTRSLATLGIDGDKYGVILTPLILSRVPQELRLEWSRDGKGHESDLKFLLSFLEKEIQRRERSQMFQESLGPSFKSSVEERRPRVATASTLQATSTVKPSKTCCFCGKNHPTEKCFKLSGSIQAKKEKLKSAGLCFRCLLPGHIARGCSVVCRKCNGRHHEIICGPPAVGPTSAGVSNVSSQPPPPPSSGNENASAATHSSSTTSFVSVANSTPPGDKSASHASVALQFARVTVHGSQGVTEATVMFDTGSDRSFVTQDLVNRVKPKWVDSEPVAFDSFGSGKPSKTDLRHIFSVNLQDNHGTDQPLLATAVDVICAPLSRPSLGHDILNSFGDISFADHYETGSVVKIDILIGMDSYWRFVLPQVLCSEVADLIAQNSVFGWIVSGCLSSGSSASHCNVSHQLLCVNVCDDTVRSFWELESVGIVSEDLESAVDPVLQEFENSVDFVDGRYEVKLPWRRGASSRLQNNEKLAAIRLQNLNRRLTHEPELQVKYDSVIQNMWSSGIVEEVLPHEQKVDRPIFYMPHRPVVRETAVSSKVRPVFDASARGYNGVSLNDCMEIGPNLLSNLTEILLRFRRWCIGISSDVEKAFLQISVSEGDRDVHRFLWNLGGETKHMRFRRVPFGNCASPFLLNATIQHHLAKFPNSRVIEELKDNLYVDDWLTGADSAEEGCKLIQEASDVMNQAAMPLAKWVSNSPAVAEVLHREFKDKFIDAESVKVLGMKWLATSDAFSFSIASLPDGLCITKRIVLSYLSRLFDPLGIAAPYVMGIKCLFQDLWRAGLQWDDELPSEFRVQFLRWVDGLQVLQQWSIPRSYTGTGWSNIRGLALHAFGDASPRGYGACVYLVAEKEDGSVVPSLVIAKAKLAPLKTVTLPRLELLACLLSARLLTFVHDALRFEKSLRYYCWSDSMVALSWIKADPSRWKAFVANRVMEIQTLTSPDRWFHCSGVENPADLLTRGVTDEELIFSKVWLQGPKFLVERRSDEVDLLEPSAVLCSVMAEETAGPVLIAATPGENVFQVERWGKLTKAIRVVALVLRFIFNSRHKQEDRRLGDVSYDEMQHARQVLIQQVQ